MINSLFRDYLLTSVTTSIVIIVWLALLPWLRKRFSAKWLYWIGLILALRLLLPFQFSADNSLLEIQVPGKAALMMMDMTDEHSKPISSLSSTAAAPEHLALTVPTTTESFSRSASMPAAIATVIWAAGFVLLVGYQLARYSLFRKQVVRWSRRIDHEPLLSQVDRLLIEMNIKYAIPVYMSSKAASPMLLGFIKPVLVLPEDRFTADELTYIIRHELVHYKRRDTGYKLLLLLVKGLHWYNPLVWILVREAGHAIELYCDETVVQSCGLAERKDYCRTLIAAMQRQQVRNLACTTQFSGRQSFMRTRLLSVLDMRRKHNGAALLISVTIMVAAMAILAACTTITGDREQPFIIGTAYGSINGDSMIGYDAGNAYYIDEEGHVMISYRAGEIVVQAPVKLDLSSTVNGVSGGGFYLSEDVSAIAYRANSSEPVEIYISNDLGQTWNTYTVEAPPGDEFFIGFRSKQEGWLTVGHMHGVGSAMNYIFQTSDGGQTWGQIGNPNDAYSEHMTGAGFASPDIGFLGFRYYADDGPVIYWTQDRGQTWERLHVALPDMFDHYRKDPLSPVFDGLTGIYPIALHGEQRIEHIIYLISDDGGLTWTYDDSR